MKKVLAILVLVSIGIALFVYRNSFFGPKLSFCPMSFETYVEYESLSGNTFSKNTNLQPTCLGAVQDGTKLTVSATDQKGRVLRIKWSPRFAFVKAKEGVLYDNTLADPVEVDFGRKIQRKDGEPAAYCVRGGDTQQVTFKKFPKKLYDNVEVEFVLDIGEINLTTFECERSSEEFLVKGQWKVPLLKIEDTKPKSIYQTPICPDSFLVGDSFDCYLVKKGNAENGQRVVLYNSEKSENGEFAYFELGWGGKGQSIDDLPSMINDDSMFVQMVFEGTYYSRKELKGTVEYKPAKPGLAPASGVDFAFRLKHGKSFAASIDFENTKN